MNNRNLFLIVLGTGKSNIKEPTDSLSGEGSLSGSQMASAKETLGPTWLRNEALRGSGSCVRKERGMGAPGYAWNLESPPPILQQSSGVFPAVCPWDHRSTGSNNCYMGNSKRNRGLFSVEWLRTFHARMSFDNLQVRNLGCSVYLTTEYFPLFRPEYLLGLGYEEQALRENTDLINASILLLKNSP